MWCWASFKSDQHGIVPLLTAIVVSMLLIIITTAVTRLTLGEQRQAIDVDQSIKAYFAAESGLEDALYKLRQASDPSDVVNEDCDPGSSSANLAPDGTVAITCQLIYTSSGSGFLDAEEVAEYDLSSINDQYNRIRISWNLAALPGAGAGSDPQLPPDFNGITGWPSALVWQTNNYPAAIELVFTSYPRTPSFRPDQITTRVVILKPHTSTTVPFAALGPPNNHLINAPCNPSADPGEYNCTTTLVFGANQHHVIRVRPRYAQAHFRFQVFHGGTERTLPLSNITLDSTGKAGDIFRRVVARVPLTPQASPVMDYVLLGGDICKDMQIMRGEDDIERSLTATGCMIHPP